MYYCNHFPYLELNVSPIYKAYYINTLRSLFKYRYNNIPKLTFLHNTWYKININIPVMQYKKQIGIKFCIYVAIKICRLLKINIQDFTNLNMFKYFIKKNRFFRNSTIVKCNK